MEFWGVEVKSGAPLNVQPGDGMAIHLSQASLGEVKANKNESVSLVVNVDGTKLALGTLLSDKLPQQLFDLVFDRDFELSHNSKSGSIYFFGYRAANPTEEEEGFDSDDSEDQEDTPLMINSGKPEIKVKQEKAVVAEKAKDIKDSATGKQKVKIVQPTQDKKLEDVDDSDDVDSDEDGSSDEDLMDEDDVDSDSEDEESEENDETPEKKVVPSKKRGAESAITTHVSEKKAKLVTPQKTDAVSDGKKSGHVATSHPSKQPGKTLTNKASQHTPKSGGSSHFCDTCKKAFGSENALQSHTKAKHSAGK